MVRDITFKGTKDEFQGSIYLSSNSKVPILDIKIKIKLSSSDLSWINVLFSDLESRNSEECKRVRF